MVATKRRFDANLQKVRDLDRRRTPAGVRLHPLPEGRQGHQGLAAAAPPAWPTRVSSASAPSSRRALAELEARREEVNDLNVFPVADGDTGDNMALTLRAVLDELDRLSGARATIDEIGRDEIVDSVARAALLGARGNSGVILSQLIRGAAEELASRPGELVDPVLVGAAMTRASDRAHGSVRDPAEGTILTVAQRHGPPDRPRARPPARAAAAPRRRRAPGPAHRRGAGGGRSTRARSPCGAGPTCCRSCARRASSTPAGSASRCSSPASSPPCAAPRRRSSTTTRPPRVTHPQHESSTYRFCTNFAVTGDGPGRRRRGSRALERLGDSVLVVGDQRTLKVHLHTDEPERAMALFADAGRVSRVDMADMHEQVQARDAPARRGGRDLRRARRRLERGHGASCSPARAPRRCSGGPTMNPSTLRAAGRHPRRARRAGRRAAELAERDHGRRARRRALGQEGRRRARRAPSRPGWPPRSRSQPERDAEANAARDARGAGAACAPARSPRPRATTPSTAARFRRGDAVGFIDEELVAWGEPAETLAGRPGRARPRRRAA